MLLGYLLWLFAPAFQLIVLIRMWRTGMVRRIPLLFSHQLLLCATFISKFVAFHFKNDSLYFWSFQLSTSVFLLLTCAAQYFIVFDTDRHATSSNPVLHPITFIGLIALGGSWSFLYRIFRAGAADSEAMLSAMNATNQFLRVLMLTLAARFLWWAWVHRLVWRDMYLWVTFSFLAIVFPNVLSGFFVPEQRRTAATMFLRLSYDVGALGIAVAVFYCREYLPTHVARIEGVLIGNYRLLEHISRGANSTVFEAEDLLLDRSVAIKLLTRSHVGSRIRTRSFLKEMNILTALSHPRICKAFAALEANGQLVMVMELLVGEELADYLPWDGSELRLSQLATWFFQTADALAYAHAQNVVHGDIHAGNVFITATGVKLLDFGMSRLVRGVPLQKAGPDLRRCDISQLGTLMRVAFFSHPHPTSQSLSWHLAQLRHLANRSETMSENQSSAVELRDSLFQVVQHLSRSENWLLENYAKEDW